MTENTSSAPQPNSYPSHRPDGPAHGNEPPYGPPQPHPGMQAPPGQWVYQMAAPPKPKSSGYRVAAGVVAIVLSLVELLLFGNAVSMMSLFVIPVYVTAAVAHFILGVGTMTAGIVLLAQHRRRGRKAPVSLLALAALTVLAAMVLVVGEVQSQIVLIVSSLLAVTVLIVLGIGFLKEKRALV